MSTLDISDSFNNGIDSRIGEGVMSGGYSGGGGAISTQYLILALVIIAVILYLYYNSLESMSSVPIKIDDNKWSKVAVGLNLPPTK